MQASLIREEGIFASHWISGNNHWTIQVNNSIRRSPSWESNGCPANQEMISSIWNPQVHHHVLNSLFWDSNPIFPWMNCLSKTVVFRPIVETWLPQICRKFQGLYRRKSRLSAKYMAIHRSRSPCHDVQLHAVSQHNELLHNNGLTEPKYAELHPLNVSMSWHIYRPSVSYFQLCRLQWAEWDVALNDD